MKTALIFHEIGQRPEDCRFYIINAPAIDEPANLCTAYKSLKSKDRGYLFAADSMGLSSFSFTQRATKRSCIW